jgi:hypothetical protein
MAYKRNARPATFTGWIRRIAGNRWLAPVGWTAVCGADDEATCQSLLEQHRSSSSPWRGFSCCEWVVLLAGRRPEAVLRRRSLRRVAS